MKVLQHHTHPSAQIVRVYRVQIDTVEEYVAIREVIESAQEANQGALARALSITGILGA